MSQIKVIPLGGVREIGKSCFVVEVDNSIFVLDCGLVYPDDALLGIDVVIPDFTYLEENKNRIEGIFLTHGHADAVGALPYLLEKVQVPVFGTELTIELAKLFVEDAHVDVAFNDYHIIDPDMEIEFKNGVTISFIKTTHSVPDSVAVAVNTEDGAIVYTGDFKLDQSADKRYQTEFGRLTDVGESGVLALLSDSREAESPVENSSERAISEELQDILLNAPGRVIVAAVASNIQRIQQVLNAAYATNKKIFLTGDKIERIIDQALRLDKITIPSKDLIVNAKQLKSIPDNELVVLETGAMGEPIKSLQLMAKGRHREINLKPDDLVFLATTPSVAMETWLARTKDMIYRAEAEVAELSDGIKTSGHGTPNELKLMINLLKPKYFIPVQGEYSKLLAHSQLAKEVGIDLKHSYIPSNGDIISFDKGRMRLTGQVPAGNVLVDGSGVGDIGNIVLKDRKILSEDGVFVAVLTISRRLKTILSGPEIISRGFIYMKTSGDLLEESQEIVTKVVTDYLSQPNFDWSELKQQVREALSRYLFEETKRRPVVLPIIMEASNYKK